MSCRDLLYTCPVGCHIHCLAGSWRANSVLFRYVSGEVCLVCEFSIVNEAILKIMLISKQLPPIFVMVATAHLSFDTYSEQTVLVPGLG